MTLQIYQDKSGEHRWRLRAANGRIMADSGEGFEAFRGAAGSFAAVMEGLNADVVFYIAWNVWRRINGNIRTRKQLVAEFVRIRKGGGV